MRKRICIKDRICLVRRMKKENVKVSFSNAAKMAVSDCMDPEALVCTDDQVLQALMRKEGGDAIVVIRSENDMDGCDATYFLMDPANAEFTYYDRVYRRMHDIPWEILMTERLIIRETVESDVDSFVKIYAEPGMTDYTDPLYDADSEKKYIREYRDKVYAVQGFGIWTVILKETGEIIGRAGLTSRAGFNGVEVGFVIGRKWQNRGLATEAVKAVTEFGMKELRFNPVYALVSEGNAPSEKVLCKCGFTFKHKTVAEGKEYQLFTYVDY